MTWPQITIIAFYGISLGISIGKHGKSAPPYHALNSLITTAVLFTILACGGFFK